MWDESCQSFRFFQRSRELPNQCSHPTPRRPSLRTVSCRSTPRTGGAWSLRKGPSWLQVGWEVRPAEGPRASQQTCLGMGQLSPVWLQKQQPWRALRDPRGPSEVMVPVLELFGAKQTDRQKQALPTVDQRRQVPRAQRPGGGSPGSLCLLFLNPLVSCGQDSFPADHAWVPTSPCVVWVPTDSYGLGLIYTPVFTGSGWDAGNRKRDVEREEGLCSPGGLGVGTVAPVQQRLPH